MEKFDPKDLLSEPIKMKLKEKKDLTYNAVFSEVERENPKLAEKYLGPTPDKKNKPKGGNSMSVKEKIIEYLQSNRRREIEIPELGEIIWANPVTVIEMEKIMNLSQAGASLKDFHIWSIIEKAEDEEGKKILTLEDKPYLEKMEWSIITRISNDIHKTITFDEAKKNSKMTPS